MLTTTRMDEARRIDMIGVASGLGSPDAGCAGAAEALRAAGLAEHVAARNPLARWHDTLRPAAIGAVNPLPAIAELCTRLAGVVCDSRGTGNFPLVLTGDHSSAIGTWSGMHAALAAGQGLGLLWIDAHLDSHTAQSTPSGAAHGMPLAALLGYGDPALTSCVSTIPKLDPECVSVIGAHDFEPEEAELLERLGVRVYGMAEIHYRGLEVVMREAVERVMRGTACFGLTVDIDAIDPEDAPAVSCPSAGGLRAADLLRALVPICSDERLGCVEIAEFNPQLDQDTRTRRIVFELCSMVAVQRGKGARLWDHQGRQYRDLMRAYPAVSLGHCHPRIVRALSEQAGIVSSDTQAFAIADASTSTWLD